MARDEVIKRIYVCVCVCVHIYAYNGIVFSHGREENPTTCDHMEGPWEHYAMWSKSKTKIV